MACFLIRPSPLAGSIEIPPSKSHALRAILFGLMAHGTSRIYNVPDSLDASSMIGAARLLGARIEERGSVLTIEGVGGRLKPAEDVISCGSSGLVLRLIGALGALIPSYTILTGDATIRSNRPVKPLLDSLQQLGAFAVSSRLNESTPIIVRGPLKGGTASLSGEDSQPVSGLLIAAAFAPEPIELRVSNPGEKPWVKLTLDWLDRFRIPYTNEGFERYCLKGGASIHGFEYTVPNDFSSAAFPLAAAIITESELTLQGLDMSDSQGDKALIAVLQKMGARIEIEGRNIAVKKSSLLKGIRIDANDFIDAVPILAVIGCFAEGKTEIVNAAIARKKESDRIDCMVRELKKMGADIEETADGFIVRPSPLQGARLETYSDHRIVLALSVAAMAAKGESWIANIESASRTYPTFCKDFRTIGAQIEVSV